MIKRWVESDGDIGIKEGFAGISLMAPCSTLFVKPKEAIDKCLGTYIS